MNAKSWLKFWRLQSPSCQLTLNYSVGLVNLVGAYAWLILEMLCFVCNVKINPEFVINFSNVSSSCQHGVKLSDIYALCWSDLSLLMQSEINFLGRLSHPNLVKLLGYCWEDKELLLVYEFMQKGSLENHLFGSKSN